jgi:hypothetical protein
MVHFIDPLNPHNRDPSWMVTIHIATDTIISVVKESDYYESFPLSRKGKDRDRTIMTISVVACDPEEAKYRALAEYYDAKAEVAEEIFRFGKPSGDFT